MTELNKELIEYKITDLKTDVEEIKSTVNKLVETVNKQQVMVDNLSKPWFSPETSKLILKVVIAVLSLFGVGGAVASNLDAISKAIGN